jgi:hypothetical protein
MATEYLNVTSCPKCGTSHRYALTVERAVILHEVVLGSSREQRRRVRQTRLFTCPIKNEEFQATFFLSETASTLITSVTVSGIDA